MTFGDFFRDRAVTGRGKLSMARLLSFLLTIDVSVLVFALCGLAYSKASVAVLGVIAGAITTLAGIVWGGLRARNTRAEPEPEKTE